MKRSAPRRISAKQRIELARRARLKRDLIAEYGNHCMTCGGNGDWRGISLSHIIALSQGGLTTRDNCILECYPDHSQRHGIREVKDAAI